MSSPSPYTECIDTERDLSRARKIELRQEMLAALRRLGRPASSVEIQNDIKLADGAQVIAMHASREPAYFRVISSFTKQRGAHGMNRMNLIDIHPHLKAG